MPSFEKADASVRNLADELLNEFATHKPLLDAGVTISFMVAWPELDENGSPIEDALTKGGMKCLGLCRKNVVRHRKEGLADATITVDGPYWDSAEDAERRSLLDHELHHISVVVEGTGTDGKQRFKRDNAGRPIIKLRKHDVEIGWFKAVAARHGQHSQERIQARQLMEKSGQIFWPDIAGTLSGKTGTRFQSLEVASIP